MTFYHKIKVLLLVSFFLFISITCNKKSPFDCSTRPYGCPITNWDDPELFPPLLVKYLDSVKGITTINLNLTRLPNGSTVNSYLATQDPVFYSNWEGGSDHTGGFNLNTFIARNTFIANKLINRSNYQYASGGSNKPAQNGIGYVYGSKSFVPRSTALQSGDKNATCSEEIHGIDCSGLLQFLFEKNGLSIDSTAEQQNPTTIKYATRASDVADLGKVPLAGLLAGDIIYWKFSHSNKAGLIGVVVKNENNDLFVLTSTGSGYNDCNKNYSPSTGVNIYRGPRLLHLYQDNDPLDPRLPLLAGGFYFNREKPVSSHRIATVGTVVEYGVIRIYP